MMFSKIRIALAFSFIALLLVACVAKDGDTGPVGPVGPAGPPGGGSGSGTQGPQGPPGEDGNANVQSYVFTVDTADWTTGSSFSDASLIVSQITQDVVDEGTIQVFRGGVSGEWQALPYTSLVGLSGGGATTFHYIFTYNVGVVNLRTFTGIGAPFPPSSNLDFKVVVIPPASLIEGMDYTNYEMMKAVYGI